ncbi:MAG: zinc ribbon domain-containing protein [Phycisphaeraceae bacterium]|nr:zinc ribbon domain-containing protein [Phycisphaeraceae bacterium]
MIFPVIYLVLVWFLAVRLRRTWSGVGVVVAAVLVLVAVNQVLGGEAGPFGGKRASLLLVLLWPYTMLIGAGGAFILALPRTVRGEYHCPNCHYDFAGLDPAGLVCPECGTPWRGKGWNPLDPEPELIKPPPAKPPRGSARSL